MPHRARGQAQPLAYHLRLPDAAQPQAIALLSLARTLINEALVSLWPNLDHLGRLRGARLETGGNGVCLAHRHRQSVGTLPGRTGGRILRAQADRKQQFDLDCPHPACGHDSPW